MENNDLELVSTSTTPILNPTEHSDGNTLLDDLTNQSGASATASSGDGMGDASTQATPPIESVPVRQLSDVAPSTLSQMRGQKGVVRQVEVALRAARNDGTKFPDSFLTGSAGLGKSQMAAIIPHEMGGTLHEALGLSLESPDELAAFLLKAEDGDGVHIDECHLLRKKVQTALYKALDQGKVYVKGSAEWCPLANITLMLSTTDEYCVLPPLRERMKLRLRFGFYSTEELTAILNDRIGKLGWSTDEGLPSAIADRARGTPRTAITLLEDCHRVCRSDGRHSITMADLDRACQLAGIDDRGLNPDEQQYLSLLRDGSCRPNVLASRLGIPLLSVLNVIEPPLLRMGLILKDKDSRRLLASDAWTHLRTSDQRRQVSRDLRLREGEVTVLAFLSKCPGGETKTQIRQKAPLDDSDGVLTEVLSRLVARRAIEEALTSPKGGGRVDRPYEGYRLVVSSDAPEHSVDGVVQSGKSATPLTDGTPSAPGVQPELTENIIAQAARSDDVIGVNDCPTELTLTTASLDLANAA